MKLDIKKPTINFSLKKGDKPVIKPKKEQKPEKKKLKLSEITIGTPKLKAHNVNLYRAYNAQSGNRGLSQRNKLILPYAAVAAVGVTAIIVLTVMNHLANVQYDELTAYINDPNNIAIYEETLDLQAKNTEIAGGTAEMMNALDCIGSYPNITTSVLERIVSCADMTTDLVVSGYEDTTGEVNFTANAHDVGNIPLLVRQFTQTGLFNNVDFTGYTQQDDGTYTINVKCILADSAGKENQDMTALPEPTPTPAPEEDDMSGPQYRSARLAEEAASTQPPQ